MLDWRRLQPPDLRLFIESAQPHRIGGLWDRIERGHFLRRHRAALQLEAEAVAQALCMTTGDFRRAYEAFVAKQKPVFAGN